MDTLISDPQNLSPEFIIQLCLAMAILLFLNALVRDIYNDFHNS